MKKLSVIIVMFDELEIIKKCIKSIQLNKIPNMEIIVVDNGVDKKKEINKINNKIKYIRSGGNIGFGNAANIGIKYSQSEYVLILTPDIELMPDTINESVEYSDKNPKVGFTTCGLYVGKNKISHSIYRKFPNITSEIFEYNYPIYLLINKLNKNFHPLLVNIHELNKPLSVEHATGAYIFLRKKILNKIGLFDPQFIFYREETDLCRRIKAAGWEIHFIPNGGVYHSGKGALHQKLTQSNIYYLESTYKYFKKYNGKLYMLFIWLVILFSSLLSTLFLLLIVVYKKLTSKKSKSEFLLGEWVKILKWHLLNLKIIFK